MENPSNPAIKNIIHIAFAMSKSKIRVGVDSGFLHGYRNFILILRKYTYTTRDPVNGVTIIHGYNNGMKINLKEEIL